MAADWSNLQSVYGLDQATINSLQKSGYSADQASQLLHLSVGSNQSSPGINLSTIGGSGISPQTLAGLANLLKGGGGGSGGQGSGTPVNPGGVDPNQPLTNLGAAALNQHAIYNATPGGTLDPKSGVSSGPTTPTVSDIVPKVPKGPWSTTPGIFTQAPNLAPTAAAPVRPTPQATAVPYTPGQSFATPPPAPGITIGGPGGSAAGVVPMQMGQPGGQMGMGQPPAAPSPINMGGPNPTRPGLSVKMMSGPPPQNWQGAGQVPPISVTPSGAGVAGAAVALGNKPK